MPERKNMRLDMITSYIFPVGRKPHHGKKSDFAELIAAFHILIQNVGQGLLKLKKILFRQQVAECDNQSKQISFTRQILISLFSYTKLFM